MKEGWGVDGAAPAAVDGSLQPVGAAAAGGAAACPFPGVAAAVAADSAGAAGAVGAAGAGVARMEGSPLERMSDEYELVTFGHGTKRCIGEKMARAMICAFLGTVLPAVDADVPRAGLPVDDNLFDLIPASKLELRNVRPRGAAPHRGAG